MGELLILQPIIFNGKNTRFRCCCSSMQQRMRMRMIQLSNAAGSFSLPHFIQALHTVSCTASSASASLPK